MQLRDFDNCNFVKEVNKRIMQRSLKFFGWLMSYAIFCFIMRYMITSYLFPKYEAISFAIMLLAIVVGQIYISTIYSNRSKGWIHQYYVDNDEQIQAEIGEVMNAEIAKFHNLIDQIDDPNYGQDCEREKNL
jgi:multisubunit Na+/H+ antiporter MnhB subunit